MQGMQGSESTDLQVTLYLGDLHLRELCHLSIPFAVS